MYINFHIFVFISTVIFFFILKRYKYLVEQGKNNTRFVFVLIVPILLYVSYYIYFNANDDDVKSIVSKSTSSINTYPASLSSV